MESAAAFAPDPKIDDPRFKIGPIDCEIAPFATPPQPTHPHCLARIALSQNEPRRFFTTSLCYDDAMDFIEGVIRHHHSRNKSTKHWRLVHGILDGHAFERDAWGHAWVERGQTVYDSRLLCGNRVFSIHEKSAWEGFWKPRYVVRYSIPEAQRMMRESKLRNAGPWDPKILNVANHFRQDIF